MKRVVGGALGVLLVGGLGFYGLRASQLPNSIQSSSPAVCDININSPVRDRLNKVYIRNTDSLTVTVSGTATRCPSATVTVTKSENGAAEVAVATPSTDGSGVWTQGLTVTNAVSTQVFARMTISGRTTTSSVVFDASTAKPKLAIAAPITDDFGVLHLAAASKDVGCSSGGNEHVYRGELGWVGDSSCAVDGQLVTSFTVTGANGGTVDVSYMGASVYSSAVSSTPQTFTPTLTLTDVTHGDLVFSATNGSGTTATTILAKVQTLIPPDVLGPDGGKPQLTIIDRRHADIDVTYVLPTIPSNVDSASIELQWTTGIITALSLQDWRPLFPGYNTNSAVTNLGNSYSQTVDSCVTGAASPPTGTGSGIVDGTCRWNYTGVTMTNNRRADGGSFVLDGGPIDIGVFAVGSLVGCTMATHPDHHVGSNYDHIRTCPPDDNGGFTRGLVYQIPHDCVLYDPSQNPQVWDCVDGAQLQSGAQRTRRLLKLPGPNTYYIWVVSKY